MCHSNTPCLFGIKVVQSNGKCCKSIRIWRIATIRMSNKITTFEFDQHHFEGHPPPGTLMLSISSFAIIEIMGFDPREARQGDIIIRITLS